MLVILNLPCSAKPCAKPGFQDPTLLISNLRLKINILAKKHTPLAKHHIHDKIIYMNIKSILLTLSLIFTTFTYTENQPNDTVIVFDLHGVLFQFDSSQILPSFWNNPSKLDFLRKVGKYFLANSDNKSIEGIMIEESASSNTTQGHLEMINPHYVNGETIALIKELKARGYRIFGCSNIGEESYKLMLEKNPDMKGLLEDCRTCSKENGYRKKDDVVAYRECCDMVREHLDRDTNPKIIFVDNLAENIQNAENFSSRIHGIKFNNTGQLRRELEAAGIL